MEMLYKDIVSVIDVRPKYNKYTKRRYFDSFDILEEEYERMEDKHNYKKLSDIF